MTDVEEWEEAKGGQCNWVNDRQYEPLGSQCGDELKQNGKNGVSEGGKANPPLCWCQVFRGRLITTRHCAA